MIGFAVVPGVPDGSAPGVVAPIVVDPPGVAVYTEAGLGWDACAGDVMVAGEFSPGEIWTWMGIAPGAPTICSEMNPGRMTGDNVSSPVSSIGGTGRMPGPGP